MELVPVIAIFAIAKAGDKFLRRRLVGVICLRRRCVRTTTDARARTLVAMCMKKWRHKHRVYSKYTALVCLAIREGILHKKRTGKLYIFQKLFDLGPFWPFGQDLHGPARGTDLLRFLLYQRPKLFVQFRSEARNFAHIKVSVCLNFTVAVNLFYRLLIWR